MVTSHNRFCVCPAYPAEAAYLTVRKPDHTTLAWLPKASNVLYWDQCHIRSKPKFHQIYCHTPQNIALASNPTLRAYRYANRLTLVAITKKQVILFDNDEPSEIWCSNTDMLWFLDTPTHISWLSSENTTCFELHILLTADLVENDRPIFLLRLNPIVIPAVFSSAKVSIWRSKGKLCGVFTFFCETITAIFFECEGAAGEVKLILHGVTVFEQYLFSFPNWAAPAYIQSEMSVEAKDIQIISDIGDHNLAYTAICFVQCAGKPFQVFAGTDELHCRDSRNIMPTRMEVSHLMRVVESLANSHLSVRYLLRYLTFHYETRQILRCVFEEMFLRLLSEKSADWVADDTETLFFAFLEQRILTPDSKRRKRENEPPSNLDAEHLQIVAARLIILEACTDRLSDIAPLIEHVSVFVPECPKDLPEAVTSNVLERAPTYSEYDELARLIVLWAKWVRGDLSCAPPEGQDTKLEYFYCNAKRLGTRAITALNHIAMLNHQHLGLVTRHTARALCFFWGRLDLLFNYGLSAIVMSQVHQRQLDHISEYCKTVQTEALEVELQKFLFLWDLSREHHIRGGKYSSQSINIVQRDMSLTLASFFGSSLYTLGIGAHMQSDGRRTKELPNVCWRRTLLSKKDAEDELSQAPDPVALQTDLTRTNRDDTNGLTERAIELGWGNRGVGDTLSHWADFHSGLQTALQWPSSCAAFDLGAALCLAQVENSQNATIPPKIEGLEQEKIAPVLVGMHHLVERRLDQECDEVLAHQMNSSLLQALAQPVSPSRTVSRVESPLPIRDDPEASHSGIEVVDVSNDIPHTPPGSPSVIFPPSILRYEHHTTQHQGSVTRTAATELFMRIWKGVRRCMFWSGAFLGLGCQGLLGHANPQFRFHLLNSFVREILESSIHHRIGVPYRSSLPPGIEIAMEIPNTSSLIEGDRIPVHHTTLYLTFLIALTLSLTRGDKATELAQQRTELFENVLHTLYEHPGYPRESLRYCFPKRLDAFLFLCASLLSDNSENSTFLGHRLFSEFLLLIQTGFVDPQCIDHLTYDPNLYTKKGIEEDMIVERRSLLLGVALGLSVAKSDSAEVKDAISATLLDQIGANGTPLTGALSQVDKSNIPAMSTHVSGSMTTFVKECIWGISIAVGLSFIHTSPEEKARALKIIHSGSIVEHMTPDTLASQILCCSLVDWFSISPTKEWISSVVPPSLTCYRHLISSRMQGTSLNSRLIFESQRALLSIVQQLHPQSPLETMYSKDMEMEVAATLAASIEDPHHIFQLHIITSATIGWVLALKHVGSGQDNIKDYIVRTLQWLDTLPMTSVVAPSNDSSNCGQAPTISLFVSHWWKALSYEGSRNKFSENLDIFGNTVVNPELVDDMREALLGMVLIGIDRETLHLAVIMLLTALGLLCVGKQDSQVDQLCGRWLAPRFTTMWGNPSENAPSQSDLEATGGDRRSSGNSGPESEKLYCIHQTCHWVVGLNNVGGGRYYLEQSDLSDPNNLALLLLASSPRRNYKSFCDNRSLPQYFHFLVIPLLRPIVSKVFQIVSPAVRKGACDGNDASLLAFGPPSPWAETIVWGTQEGKPPTCVKSVCLLGAQQSQDILLGKWSELQTLSIRSQYHIPMILDRGHPLLASEHTIPQILFVQALPSKSEQSSSLSLETRELGKENDSESSSGSNHNIRTLLVTI